MRAFLSFMIGAGCGLSASVGATHGQYATTILAFAVFGVFIRVVERKKLEQ